MEQSVLKDIRFKLQHPDEFKKMCHLIEGIETNVNCSFYHLAFSVLLAFELPLKVNTLRNQLRDSTFTPEEALDILGKATIDCGNQEVNSEKR